jgi:NAD(P)-dependent dehydrogenase (short-subunit alcohol dehydrogenase family)
VEIPLNRPTTAADMAEAIAWQPSSETDHIVGSVLNVDGGFFMDEPRPARR